MTPQASRLRIRALRAAVQQVAGGAGRRRPNWQLFQLPFVADDAYAAGMAQLNFQLGFAPQTVEIGGVELLNYRNAVKWSDLPRTRRTYAGREPDAHWRKVAAGRIEKFRKADLTVVVTDAAGKPVPGAAVEVRMRRHAFGFGSAVTAEMLLGDSPDSKQYQQHVKDLFSRVVLENDLKWQGWKANRQRGLDAVGWLRREGIEVRGHNLVWPGWQYLPKDIVALKGQPDALRKAIADHVTDEATALRGQLVEWDVINEPWNNHDVADVLGKDVLVDWFKLAKAADPGRTAVPQRLPHPDLPRLRRRPPGRLRADPPHPDRPEGPAGRDRLPMPLQGQLHPAGADPQGPGPLRRTR